MTLAAFEMPGVNYPPADVLKAYQEKGYLGDVPLAVALREAFAGYGDGLALNGPDGQMSYAELNDKSDRFAAALLDLGLEPLDRVIFQVVNSIEVIIALTACWKADLIPVCTLAAHRKAEISYLGNHAEAKAHFIGVEENFDFLTFAEEMRGEVPSIEHTIIIRGDGPDSLPSMAGLIGGQDSEAAADRIGAMDYDPYQVAVFQLSGGTTSIPKIIPRFSNEYLYNITSWADKLELSPTDSMHAPLQLVHNAGALNAFALLIRGGTLLVSTANDPLSTIGLLQEFKPSVFFMLSAPLKRMSDMGIVDMLDLSGTRMVISPNAARQTEEVLGVTGVHIFGMTEGVCTFGRKSDPQEARYTTIGTPLSPGDEMKIYDPEEDRELPKGEVGELVIKGPYTFHGYYNAEDRNAEVFTKDGYYRSGDLMSVHEFDGEDFWTFEGRLKDFVSRGGEKINCEEVEMAARQHPGIADIAIVAMPDKEMDEKACAFVIPAIATEAPDVKGLMQFLVEKGMAKFKCPERIEIIDEFPQTDSGKTSKPKMKQMIVDILAKEEA